MSSFTFSGKVKTKGAVLSRRTVADHVRMHIKCAQGSSIREGKKLGRYQPSLPKVVFSEDKEDDR